MQGSKPPIMIDTGASISVTPHLSDFVGPLQKSDIAVLHGLSTDTQVVGYGDIEWSIRDVWVRFEK